MQVGTSDFLQNDRLEVYDRNGNTAYIEEGVCDDDLWMAPSGEYVLIREIMEKTDEGKVMIAKLKKMDLDANVETVRQFTSSFSIQPTGLSERDEYYIVLTSSERGEDYNSLLLFKNSDLLWSDTIRAEGGYTTFFSNQNKYVIVNVTVLDERQGNIILTHHIEHLVYQNPSGRLIISGVLSHDQINEYRNESSDLN